MANLETNYLGLHLKSPLIVSSSGLMSNISKIKEAQENGAGAIVLKSIFEEQINFEAANYHNKGETNPEAFDYLQGYVSANSISNYIDLIKEAKKAVTIPVIASINCATSNQWVEFAKSIENAGADALELNIYLMPVDRSKEGRDIEKEYLEIVKKVVKKTNLPVSVKLSNQFTNIIRIVDEIKGNGAKGVVLFNRLYEPDIDIEKLEMTTSNVFSSESDIRFTLRWAALVSDRIKGIDMASSTGVHNAQGAIKMILAGADAVQVCSILYQKGMGELKKINSGIEDWMKQRGFESLASFRGLMSYKSIPDPAFYQRSQFMKYFSNFE